MNPFLSLLPFVPIAAAAADFTATEAVRPDVRSLVEAERAFSAMSVERGMKDAFLAYLADDGIVFAPGPVNGPKRWRSRPRPQATLIWEPSYAEVSASGDLGLSTGPWELRPPSGADSSTLHGHFISVWRRDGEEPWRVALDIGISHQPPEPGLGKVTLEAGPVHERPPETSGRSGAAAGRMVVGRRFGIGIGDFVASRRGLARSRAHEIHRMMSAERTYSFELRRGGAEGALRKVAGDDVRVYREGVMPTRGIAESLPALERQPRRVEWLPEGRGISGSLDLGFSYGLARRWPQGISRPDTSAYLHVWHRSPDSGAWRLIADVESPFPRR